MAAFGYRVLLMPAAQRDMDALEGKLPSRIERAVLRLAEVPRPHGVKKLVGSENAYRVRVGSHRILYEIDDSRRVVSVYRIAHRSEAYRK